MKKNIFLSMITLLPFSLFCMENSPDSMQKLIEGNRRYVESKAVCHEDWTAKRAALAEGQSPFAVVVTCSDSRVPPEIIFDQSLGDLFIVRLAGNVVDELAIGSIVYAVEALKADLIMVLGHEKCGAVDAAIKGLKFKNQIDDVLREIRPAVRETRKERSDVLEKTIKANIRNVEEKIKTSKPTLSKSFEEGKVKVIGGYYELESGKVEILSMP
jgi:carbonic anhydrase